MAKAQQSESTDVAKQDQLPAAYDYGDTAGAGFENQTREDYSIPFLAVLQGLSPQIEEVDGAKPGMIINTVTNDLFKEGVAIIPATTMHCFVEWKPRDAGGGFVAVHTLDSKVVTDAKAGQTEPGKISLPNGNDLVETYYLYGLNVREDGGVEQVVLAFTSTKIKVYRDWMTKAKGIQIVLPGGRRINAPLPAHRYRLKTVKQKNPKGEFWNWTLAFDGADAVSCRIAPTDPLFSEAIEFGKLVNSGAAKAAYETQGGSGGDKDPDAPF